MHGFTPMMDLFRPDGVADRRDARTFGRSMLLGGAPTSPQANALVSAIAEGVICPYKAQRGQLRHSSVRKYHQIVAPFLTDLLRAAADDRWSKLATNTNALPDYPGGAEAFKAMRAAMGAAELIDELPGYTRSYQMFGETQTRTSRTSFRPTPKLLQLAESHGVHLRDLKAHFRASTGLRPRAVLEARAAKDSKKTAPKAAEIDPNDPVASFIREGVQALNGHLLEDGRIEGISFAGLRRVFCNADQPGFSWQWHGRYYSARGADAYEAMEGGQASRQRVIRIDGHPVAEVDISAAHLTILHGLLELPFDASTDPYALDSVDRVHVKKWLTIALGAADPTAGGATLSKARAAGLERYPFLKDLPALGISALDLQYHEAEIMRLAMDDLRTLHGIGFLPVHDALMVATGNEEKAAQAIRSGFQRHFEGRGLPPIIPRVR